MPNRTKYIHKLYTNTIHTPIGEGERKEGDHNTLTTITTTRTWNAGTRRGGRLALICMGFIGELSEGRHKKCEKHYSY